jgi:hypothetical protein
MHRVSSRDDTNGALDADRDSLCGSGMPPARRVLGISWDFVAEAEPISIRNRSAGGESVAVRDTVIHVDRSAPGDGSADADGALRSEQYGVRLAGDLPGSPEQLQRRSEHQRERIIPH